MQHERVAFPFDVFHCHNVATDTAEEHSVRKRQFSSRWQWSIAMLLTLFPALGHMQDQMSAQALLAVTSPCDNSAWCTTACAGIWPAGYRSFMFFLLRKKICDQSIAVCHQLKQVLSCAAGGHKPVVSL